VNDFWKGSIVPAMQKHRDYEHETFFEHEMDNGGRLEIDPDPVVCDRDPVDFSIYSPSRMHYFVDFTLHTNVTYAFLIQAEADKSMPNPDTIQAGIEKQIDNPIKGGRDWLDYLDLNDPLTLDNDRVRDRLDTGDIQHRPKVERKPTSVLEDLIGE
jgi:hypothetical protein